MSDLKPIMVRLPPDVYEKLRIQAFHSAIPPAVLARSLIKQQLEALAGSAKEELEEPSPAPSSESASTPSPAPSSSPGRRSPNAKRRKKKRGR